MAKVIKTGIPYKCYDFTCPKCHSIVRFGESELHEYEDCYDIEMVETDERCPNCQRTTIYLPKSQLHLYEVKPHASEEEPKPTIDANIIKKDTKGNFLKNLLTLFR